MTATPTITVTIDADGSTAVSVAGLAGPGCKSLTAAVERALGSASDTRQTAEHAQQSAGQTLGQSGGAA